MKDKMKFIEKYRETPKSSSSADPLAHRYTELPELSDLGLVNVQRATANMAIQRLLRPSASQAKLQVSHQGDAREQEGNLMADRAISYEPGSIGQHLRSNRGGEALSSLEGLIQQ